MEIGFDLKIFMMIDANKNNIQPEFYKILPVRWKGINFFFLFHMQTDRK
jgi:hypothetical protein